MTRRRVLWLALALVVVVAGAAASLALLALPRLAREAAVWQLTGLTGRPVTIEALDLDLARGEFSVRGFRIADRDGGRLADFERLEGRFRPVALLRGHLDLDRVTLSGAHLRVVRIGPNRFNVSDLLERPGGGGRRLPISVAHLDVSDSSITFDDRVLTPARSWRADGIRLDVRDVTTQGRTGTAIGSTTVAGALVTLRADEVTFTPLHLRAFVNVRDLDLRLPALYLPADAAVVLERGSLDAGVTLVVDAAEGTTLDADAVVERLALRRPGLEGDAATAPSLQVLVRDLKQRSGAVSLRYASVGGDVTVLDPTTSMPRRLTFSDFTATASGLEQPMRGQTQVALHATVPGGGEVEVGGTVGFTPRKADLRVRARGLELATLGRYLPIAGRLDGLARADVRVTAAQEQTLTLAVAGDATLERVALGDGTRTLAGAARVAATGLEYTWPATVRVGQLTVSQPAVTLERDAGGAIGLAALVVPAAPAEDGSPAPATPKPGARPTADVAIAQLRLEDGRALVTDAATGARVDARRIALTADAIAWPAGGPARVRASAAIDGMEVSAQGTVEAAKRAADVALRVRGADLATLQPWLPIAGRVHGAAEADVRVVASHDGTLRLTVTGDAALHRAALLDGTRPLAAAARVAATGIEYTWPATARVAHLTVSQPEATVERAADGTLSLAAPLRRRVPDGAEAAAPAGEGAATARPALDVAVGRLEIADGRATLTDAAVNGRAQFTRVALDARDVAWPARGDAPVRLSAAVAGGEVTGRGTVDLGARKAELAVTLRNTDLAALQPWLPINGLVQAFADADVMVTAALDPFTLTVRGRAGASSIAFYDGTQPLLTVRRVDAAGLDVQWPTRLAIDRLRVDAPWAKIERDPQGSLSLRTLFARPAGRAAPPPPDAAAAAIPGPVPGLQVTVRDALFENGGANIVDDAVEPAARFEVKGSRVALRDLSWPSRGVAAVELSTPMPGREGTLKARGTFSIEPTRLVLDVDLDKVDLAPARPYLPIDARLSGRLSGRAKLRGDFGDTITLAIDGDATAEHVALGDDIRRLATARLTEIKGLRYRYPTSLRVKTLALDKPWLLLERDSSGRLELVTLVTTRTKPPPPPAGATAAGAPAPRPAPAPPEREPRVRVLIETLTMQDGFVRFVDRTTEPDYAEEIWGIALAATDLGTRPSRRGKVMLRGTFASGTPLAVNGEIGGFTGPRYLDATVEIRDFPMPRLNPYLIRQLGWVAKSGTMTAVVHYRIVGDDLEATNDITLVGFDVERPASGAGPQGPPLDTIVSLLKNREGVIKLNVPVSGSLSAPEFAYGDAVWAAMRNLAIRLVALPFSLVGKMFFTQDSHIQAVTVDPVTFQTAKATPTAAGLQQLDKLAAFLKQAPAIRLRLRPVTTVADVGALRREALDSRLASLGHDADARRRAAVGLYTELFPRRQPPTSDEALLEELTRETPTPPRALRDLAANRVAAISDALIRAGIGTERLERLESRTAVESEGAARVEFEVR